MLVYKTLNKEKLVLVQYSSLYFQKRIVSINNKLIIDFILIIITFIIYSYL